MCVEAATIIVNRELECLFGRLILTIYDWLFDAQIFSARALATRWIKLGAGGGMYLANILRFWGTIKATTRLTGR